MNWEKKAVYLLFPVETHAKKTHAKKDVQINQ